LQAEDNPQIPNDEAFAFPRRPGTPPRDVSGAAFRSTRVPILVGVFGAGLLLFLAVTPARPWILMLVTALVAIGTDGILREHPHAQRENDMIWTAPLLFLPTLLALGSGLYLEEVLDGYWIVPGAVASALLMGAVLYAETASIDGMGHYYPAGRFVLNVGTFLAAFAFYVVVYEFQVSLLPAALTVGLVSMLLAVEVLREAETDPIRALVYAGSIGLVVAEARWALYFLPLESYLAGVFLLLCFYVSSGLVQHHLDDDLHAPVAIEFSVISLLGVVIVALGLIFETNA
jgi:hypothetical protein